MLSKRILSEADRAQIDIWLRKCRKFVLTAHVSPDGDAVGSCLAMAGFLRKMGKTVNIVLPGQAPDFLHWMEGYDQIIFADRQADWARLLFAQADVILIQDYNSLSRVEEMAALMKGTKADFWMIDHHLLPDSFCKVTVSDTEASSTSELVYRIIDALGHADMLDHQMAEAIYAGMCTDTGGFTYSSGNAEIYLIISKLLETGIDKDWIYRKIYNNYSSDRVHLLGYILYEKLEVLDDVHASFFTLTREEMKRFHFIRGDAEGIVNIPLTIKNMKLSISLREDTEKPRVLVSLRSVDDFPCNRMAEEFFNGGGHLNAAGGRLEMTMEEAVHVCREAIEHYRGMLMGTAALS